MTIPETPNPTMATVRAVQDGAEQVIEALQAELVAAQAKIEQAVAVERARCLTIVRSFDHISDRWEGMPIDPRTAFVRIHDRIAGGWALDAEVEKLKKGTRE